MAMAARDCARGTRSSRIPFVWDTETLSPVTWEGWLSNWRSSVTVHPTSYRYPLSGDGRWRPEATGRQRGKTSDAALLCLHHHRRFDHDGWELHIDGTTVTFHRTNRTDQADRPGRTDQTDQPDQLDRTDRTDRPGRPPDVGGHDPPDNRGRAGPPDPPPDDAGDHDPPGDAGGHDPPDNRPRTEPPDPPPGDAGGRGRPGDSDRAPP
jgi:hypothetical protein